MNERLYLLGEVSRRLGLKPHQITYALTSGLVEEVGLRLGNRRMFQERDVARLAQHFQVGNTSKEQHE